MSPLLNCSDYNTPTAEDFREAKVATILLDVVVCLEYSVTVALSIFLGTYQRFISRLLLYLIVVILFFTISDAIKIAAFADFDGSLQLHESTCIAAAFCQQFFLWLVVSIVCGMTLHVSFLSVYRKDVHSRPCEVCAVVTVVAVALLFSVIPIIPIEGSLAYGWSEGFTCWIRTINITSCETFVTGRVEQFLLWYVWCAVAFTCMIVSLMISIRALYKQFRMEGATDQLSMQLHYKQALKEAVALLIYIIIFIILILVKFCVHLSLTYSSSIADTWILDAIFSPLLFLLVPIAFILHPATAKKLRCSELRKAAKRWTRRVQSRQEDVNTTETNFIVSLEPEFSGEQRLIIRGTPGHGQNPNYASLEGVIGNTTLREPIKIG